MRETPEIEEVSVVLVGTFEPVIFTPAWFELHGLLSEEVVESADVAVAHPQLTKFKAEWLDFEVRPDRYQVKTAVAPHIRVHDLILRVFREQIRHTPVRAFGINRDMHFLVKSAAARDRLGRRLAPVAPWGRWKDDLGLDGEHGGMKSLTMCQVDPEGRPPGGQINVKVEPSVRVGNGRTGVYVGVNDHYDLGEPGLDALEQTMSLLAENFQASLGRSGEIADHLIALAQDTGD